MHSLPPTLPLTLGAVALALVAPFAATLAAQQPSGEPEVQPDAEVRESIAVLEASTLVELPRLGEERRRGLAPADFVVQEDGVRREITSVTALDPQSSEWTVLVYFDPLLATADTVALGAFTLADHAADLVALGPVRLVTSAPETQEWLPPSRDEFALAAALRSIAESRIGRDGLATLRRAQDPPAERLAEESFFLRERADALLLETSEGCPTTPCLLVLVSEGFDTVVEASYPAEATATETPPHAEIARELEGLLAGFGWTVLALPLAPPAEPAGEAPPEGPGTDYYAWKREAGGVQMPRPSRRGNRLSGLSEQALDVFVNARLQTLRAWAAASAGATLRLPQQVGPELRRLRNRVRVAYRTDRSGPPVRSLDVRLAAISPFQERREVRESLGLVPEEEPLRAPRYAVSGVPTALSGARVRSLAFGKRLTGELALEQQPGTDGKTEIRWPSVPPQHPVRVSVVDPEGELSHRVESVSSETRNRLQLEPATTGWVLVEDLRTRAWGVLELQGGEGLLE